MRRHPATRVTHNARVLLTLHLPALPCPAPQGVMRKLYPESAGPLTDVPNTGCSPTLMRWEQWARVTPRWEALTAQVRGRGGAAPCAAGWSRFTVVWCRCACRNSHIPPSPHPGFCALADRGRRGGKEGAGLGELSRRPARGPLGQPCSSALPRPPASPREPPSRPRPASRPRTPTPVPNASAAQVREMYAFSVAAALEKVSLDLQVRRLRGAAGCGCRVCRPPPRAPEVCAPPLRSHPPACC